MTTPEYAVHPGNISRLIARAVAEAQPAGQIRRFVNDSTDLASSAGPGTSGVGGRVITALGWILSLAVDDPADRALVQALSSVGPFPKWERLDGLRLADGRELLAPDPAVYARLQAACLTPIGEITAPRRRRPPRGQQVFAGEWLQSSTGRYAVGFTGSLVEQHGYGAVFDADRRVTHAICAAQDALRAADRRTHAADGLTGHELDKAVDIGYRRLWVDGDELLIAQPAELFGEDSVRRIRALSPGGAFCIELGWPWFPVRARDCDQVIT
ncbi:hypothetical protein [Longispora albida]|uniref:hypothetical protein n=1 Tax=Longispora albida TaxID=203523 RepID=UPI00036B9981|nr:hypothetical protein [Longispora albida]